MVQSISHHVYCIRTWQYWSPNRDDDGFLPPNDITVISVLFCALCFRSAYKEIQQLYSSIPSGQSMLIQRIFSSEYFKDFWNWLDMLHIIIGISVVILVWMQSSKALPVLAIASFFRWWGTLFYLQVCICCLTSVCVNFFISSVQAFDSSGPYVRMLVEIVKAIRWFMIIMFISILATWNAFTLLLKRPCPHIDDDSTCESPRNAVSVFETMYDMINTLLFGNGDVSTLRASDYYFLVVPIFIFSMIAMPIVLLNMLIAIMGDSYELIQVRF